ncbi:replication factor C large subunit [archaeon]|nr:replication factor C large subunit [archaeon]
MWLNKYAPKNLSDFAGNSSNIAEITNWVKTWKSQPKKALILEGSSGVGKSTALNLIAKELGLNTIITSASETRTAKAIATTFGVALSQQSLFFKGKLVIFDEIDALSGKSDRGAVGEIVKLIKKSKHPIIFVANDFSGKKLAPLKKESKKIKFQKIPTPIIADKLEVILKNENINYDDRALKSIARQADGDIRAAINDLEVLAHGVSELTYDAIKDSGYRDFRKPVQDVLTIIFKTTSVKNSTEALSISDTPLDTMVEWVRENIPREYKKSDDVARAYQMLSRANIFMGRIHTRQYWRYLVYVSSILSAGISTAKTEKYPGMQTYHYPTKISLLGASMFSRAKNDALAKKLSPHLHCSKREAKKYFPIINLIQQNQPDIWDSILTKID